MTTHRESVQPFSAAGRAAGLASAALAVLGGLTVSFAPSTTLAASGVVVLVAASALSPASGLYLLAGTLPFYLHQKSFGSLAFSIPEIILLAVVAGTMLRALWKMLRDRESGLCPAPTSMDAPIATLIGASLLSLVASEVLRVSLRDLRTLIIEPIAAFYLASWYVRRDRVPLLIAALIAGGVGAAVLGLYQYRFTSHVVAVEGATRMLGPYLSPNQMALYMGRSIPLALAASLFVPSARLLAIPATLVLLLALILTFSIGGWLAVGLSISAVVLLWRPRALLLLFVAALALAVAGLPVLGTERFLSHLSPTTGTSFIRVQLWESSIRMALDHPILGVGMDNFLYHYRGSYILPGAVAEPNLSHPHNLVLNFWLQIGIPGLAAFVWVLAALARSYQLAWRTARSPWSRAILAGIAGAAVDLFAHGAVDNSYFLADLAFHFWLLAGVLVIISRHAAALPDLERIE